MPASASVGVYLISPVFSSIVASFGASLPNVYFVPSGTFVAFPSLSVTFGFTVVFSPAFPFASSYFTSYLSASFSAGVVSVTVTGTVTSTSLPFGRVTVTTASVSPALDTSGSVFTTTFDPFGRFVIFSLYWSTVGCVPTVVSTFPSTLASHFFGFWSLSSLIPSLSSSGSVESGIPSPSVSLNIVIWISFVDSFPAASFALIVTVKSLSSSVSAQFVSLSGVPSILPVSLL